MDPTFPVPTYLLGLDLGKMRDFTALVVLRQTTRPTGRMVPAVARFNLRHGTTYREVPETEFTYELLHADRWRGRSYRSVVPEIHRVERELWERTNREHLDAGGRHALDTEIALVVDMTGVGIAVVDDLRANGLACIGVTITGGDSVTRSGEDVRVPKRELVGTLQVLLQANRLAIPDAAALPLAGVLVAELENFRATIKLSTGHDTYGAGEDWRDRSHDDLVLALAMAAWHGEQRAGADWSDLEAYARLLTR
jgi:hypothetical protein